MAVPLNGSRWLWVWDEDEDFYRSHRGYPCMVEKIPDGFSTIMKFLTGHNMIMRRDFVKQNAPLPTEWTTTEVEAWVFSDLDDPTLAIGLSILEPTFGNIEYVVAEWEDIDFTDHLWEDD